MLFPSTFEALGIGFFERRLFMLFRICAIIIRSGLLRHFISRDDKNSCHCEAVCKTDEAIRSPIR